MLEMQDKNAVLDTYQAAFAAQKAAQAPGWLLATREEAFARFTRLGFPTTYDEEWKFTNVAPIAGTPFRPAGAEVSAFTATDLHPYTFEEAARIRLVFVNGQYRADLSVTDALPAGVRVVNLADALTTNAALLEEHLARYARTENAAFTALNTALHQDGAFVHVPQGVIVEEPIYLLFAAVGADAPVVSHPRTLVLADANSQLTLIESYVGESANVTFTNAITEVVVGENAAVEHYKVQEESRTAFHVATTEIALARHSRFASQSLGLGGALVRNDINAKFHAENGECTLNGLYTLSGRQHHDNHTAIDHAMPHCNSHELYKGVLDDRSRGVFNGKIFVREDAQKTDAKQTNKTLLLSREAIIDTKPQLEIFADDVKCTHGATIGQLDADSLFYLRSRGIGLAEARALLTYAFAYDIVGRIKVEPVRRHLESRLLAILPGR